MKQRVRVLMGWLIATLVLCYLSSAGAQESESEEISASASESLPIEDRNPCSFRGAFLLHGEETRLDPCTLCTCRNGTTTCNIESCPSDAGCLPSEIVNNAYECCPLCPYKMFVENTNTLHVDSFVFTEGDIKTIMFDLDVEVERQLSSRVVQGGDLWKLESWVSRYDDGSGQKYSHKTQLFNRKDMAQEYSKSNYPPWQWKNLNYTMKFLGGTCGDYKYFCVKFDQADNPAPAYSLSFTFQPVDDEHYRLIDCVPLGECTVSIENRNPCSFRGAFLLHGEETRFDPCTLCTCINGTTACGIESCPRDPGCLPSEIFIIAEECCPQCLGTEDRNPCLFLRELFMLHGEETRTDPCTLCTCINGTTNCITEACPPDPGCLPSEVFIIAEECCPQCPDKMFVTRTNITDYRWTELCNLWLTVEVSVEQYPRNIIGDNLWKLGAWLSAEDDGSGQKYFFQQDILDEEHAKKTYHKSKHLLGLTYVSYAVNDRRGTCDDCNHVCSEFNKGDDPEPRNGRSFNVKAVNNDSLIGCHLLEACSGIRLAEGTTHSPSTAPSDIQYDGDGLFTASTVLILTVIMVMTTLLVCLLLVNKWRRRLLSGRRRRNMLPASMYYTRNEVKEQVREVEEVLKDKETDHARVTLERKLGEGEFGVVHKGILRLTIGDKSSIMDVAIKTTKVGAVNEAREDLLSEIKLVAELGEHPNILSLIACCTSVEPFYLITEFMQYGDLLGFLRKCRQMEHANQDPIYSVGEDEQLIITRDIAKGMAYIQDKRYIHGDLAARNVLIGDKLIVKISDFGLADNIYTTGYRRKTDQKIPVKWCSIETILNGICSPESDVWSFGVLLYEVFTFGGTPYPGINPRFLVSQLKQGHRMEQPTGCPDDVYKLMGRCWEEIPGKRPTFWIISEEIAGMLMARSDYLDFDSLGNLDEIERYVRGPCGDKTSFAPIDDENNDVDIEQLQFQLNAEQILEVHT